MTVEKLRDIINIKQIIQNKVKISLLTVLKVQYSVVKLFKILQSVKVQQIL